ncbi:MAG: hypothetical protein JO000_21155 [Alphaproteobacteria bacterium]|nr:hypothetical protein [Alphaproteobacteria bacterium]
MAWPSTFPAGTLGYMKDRIADELGGRSDLASQIAVCVSDAIAVYQAHRFRFSESRDLCQFNTVAAQEFYTATDNATIATLYLFDYVTVTLGVTNFALSRRQPEDVELLSQTGTQRGMPLVFSYYNEQLRLYPVPDAAYPMLVAGHMAIAAPSSDSATGNRWMLDAERLIRSRAKYELAVNYGVDYPDLAARMHPETGATADAYSELKQVANKLTGRGRVTPTGF